MSARRVCRWRFLIRRTCIWQSCNTKNGCASAAKRNVGRDAAFIDQRVGSTQDPLVSIQCHYGDGASGAQRGNRTLDLFITSEMLYH